MRVTEVSSAAVKKGQNWSLKWMMTWATMTTDLCVLQAIDWIEELCEVMVRTHNDMGSSAQEADALQEDNRKFEATASVSRLVP